MKIPRGIKWGCLVPISIVIVLLGVLWIVDAVIPSAGRRALPSSAIDIQEYYSGTWNGDFARLIKARIPMEDFDAYAKALKLYERFDATKHADIGSMIEIGIGDAPGWWDPPRVSATTYFEHVQGHQYVRALNYSKGNVYYLTTSW